MHIPSLFLGFGVVNVFGNLYSRRAFQPGYGIGGSMLLCQLVWTSQGIFKTIVWRSLGHQGAGMTLALAFLLPILNFLLLLPCPVLHLPSPTLPFLFCLSCSLSSLLLLLPSSFSLLFSPVLLCCCCVPSLVSSFFLLRASCRCFFSLRSFSLVSFSYSSLLLFVDFSPSFSSGALCVSHAGIAAPRRECMPSFSYNLPCQVVYRLVGRQDVQWQ